MTTPKADWYQDPQDPEGLRYWDGTQWTTQTRQAPPPAPPNMAGSVSLMPPPAPHMRSVPTRKDNTLTVIGKVVAILGALPLGLAAFTLLRPVVAPGDPLDDQWSGLAALILVVVGLPVFSTGLIMFFSGKVRERRIALANETTNSPEAITGVEESLVAPVLGIVLSIIPFLGFISLMLSLYGYFGNKAGTKARLIGLVGIFVNLAVALFQVLRM
jgi:hypothetical protein